MKLRPFYRLLFMLVLLELTFAGFNYYSIGGDYQYSWHQLNPFRAISDFTRFLHEQLRWDQFFATFSIIILLFVLGVFYYYLASIIFNGRKSGENRSGPDEDKRE